MHTRIQISAGTNDCCLFKIVSYTVDSGFGIDGVMHASSHQVYDKCLLKTSSVAHPYCAQSFAYYLLQTESNSCTSSEARKARRLVLLNSSNVDVNLFFFLLPGINVWRLVSVCLFLLELKWSRAMPNSKTMYIFPPEVQ